MFRAIDPDCWERARANPRRLLNGIGRRQMQQADRDAELTARIERLASELRNDRHRPWRERPISPQHPVAFCCAQFGVHGSLPIYSGGLGILAGDILKEASDLALPMVGVGLMYRTGYFHQRIDVSGRAAFQEDNDTALASQLVGGCDWWVNLPRPPLEASGTSGMKSVLGGGLQLSVLDGWWGEAYDGSNGWAIDGRVDPTTKRRTCATPTCYPNCSSGRWCRCFTNAMPKASRNAAVVMMRRGLVTNGPRFSPARTL